MGGMGGREGGLILAHSLKVHLYMVGVGEVWQRGPEAAAVRQQRWMLVLSPLSPSFNLVYCLSP